MKGAAERYLKLVRSAAVEGRPITTASGLRAGLALCDALDPTKRSAVTEEGDILDGGGHRRPFYAGLAAYAAALAHRIDASFPTPMLPTWPTALPMPVAAADASFACAAAWTELAAVAAETSKHSPTLDELAKHADPRGPLFVFDRLGGDNPEPWWYHELIALHAMTSYASLTGNHLAAEASLRSTAFHHAETQPDHATGQPWGLNAFLSDAEYLPTADLLLLAAGVGRPGGVDVISRLLLADTAVWLVGGPAKVRA